MNFNGQMTFTDITPGPIRYQYVNGMRLVTWPGDPKPFLVQGFRSRSNQTQPWWFVA